MTFPRSLNVSTWRGRWLGIQLSNSLLTPDQIHQVGRVFAVVDGEGRIEPYPFGIFSQKVPMAWEVPADIAHHSRATVFFPELTGKMQDLVGHLCSRLSREGHEEESARPRR